MGLERFARGLGLLEWERSDDGSGYRSIDEHGGNKRNRLVFAYGWGFCLDDSSYGGISFPAEIFCKRFVGRFRQRMMYGYDAVWV